MTGRACQPQCFAAWKCLCGASMDAAPTVRVRVPLLMTDSAPISKKETTVASKDELRPDRDAIRREAAFDHYVQDLGLAWSSDNGAAAASADAAGAHSEMVSRLTDAWRGG